jgi:hypothetical protein
MCVGGYVCIHTHAVYMRVYICRCLRVCIYTHTQYIYPTQMNVYLWRFDQAHMPPLHGIMLIIRPLSIRKMNDIAHTQRNLPEICVCAAWKSNMHEKRLFFFLIHSIGLVSLLLDECHSSCEHGNTHPVDFLVHAIHLLDTGACYPKAFGRVTHLYLYENVLVSRF